MVKLTSPADDPGGIRLVREFRLVPHGESVGPSCTQTMTNVSKETREVCHWGRSFSPGGGICVVPLGDRPSRFPSKYAMYEKGALINVKAKDENIRDRTGSSRSSPRRGSRSSGSTPTPAGSGTSCRTARFS